MGRLASPPGMGPHLLSLSPRVLQPHLPSQSVLSSPLPTTHVPSQGDRHPVFWARPRSESSEIGCGLGKGGFISPRGSGTQESRLSSRSPQRGRLGFNLASNATSRNGTERHERQTTPGTAGVHSSLWVRIPSSAPIRIQLGGTTRVPALAKPTRDVSSAYLGRTSGVRP